MVKNGIGPSLNNTHKHAPTNTHAHAQHTHRHIYILTHSPTGENLA